ncbi:uncharacterized protein FTOL_07828 [Fusarium torulosum]|uniref:Uncharacterized protein n=1 Tax=Fusarium torulosum TaxID=33205 RepID=A0AAE8MCS1_9HYPO|nr:uncharacterized protein FTOL_07828 [Fusarium torulosum]
MSSKATLLKLCQQCKGIETELQQALSGLQARGDTKFNYAVSSVATAFIVSWSQSKINDLDRRLQSIKSEITMAILISLWTEEKGHFEASAAFREWQSLSLSEIQALLESLFIKESGVFLWVYLVVRDLASALSQGKSLSELRSIVDSLPTDIMELYNKMYDSLDPGDAMNSSVYLTLQMASLSELEARTLWFIEENVWIPQADFMAHDAAVSILKRRLDSSTRGMLELYSNGMVFLHHISVKEWLSCSGVSSLISARLPRSFDANLMLLEAHVNNPWEVHEHYSFDSFKTIGFRYAMRAVESVVNGPVLIHHMDKLKEVLDQAAQAHIKAKAPDFFHLAMQASEFSRRQKNTKDLDSTPKQGDTYEVGHRPLIFHNLPGHVEDCFTSVAAQFAVKPYVMVKVKENKKLLKL